MGKERYLAVSTCPDCYRDLEIADSQLLDCLHHGAAGKAGSREGLNDRTRRCSSGLNAHLAQQMLGQILLALITRRRSAAIVDNRLVSGERGHGDESLLDWNAWSGETGGEAERPWLAWL